MLKVDDLSVSFGGVKALDRVSFEIERGSAWSVIGPNGSGKSTLLNAITGVVLYQGLVTVDGIRTNEDSRIRRALLGKTSAHGYGMVRTFQTPQVVDDLSCLDNVLLGCGRLASGVGSALFRRRRMKKVEDTRYRQALEALELFGIREYSDREAGSLTYGNRRWLELARAWMAEPRILLADEPSAGLNDEETERLEGYLRYFTDQDVTLVLVDHKVEFLSAVTERAIVLDLGRLIYEADVNEVWDHPEVQAAYLGSEAAS